MDIGNRDWFLDNVVELETLGLQALDSYSASFGTAG